MTYQSEDPVYGDHAEPDGSSWPQGFLDLFRDQEGFVIPDVELCVCGGGRKWRGRDDGGHQQGGWENPPTHKAGPPDATPTTTLPQVGQGLWFRIQRLALPVSSRLRH